jgi:hypothetical protein
VLAAPNVYKFVRGPKPYLPQRNIPTPIAVAIASDFTLRNGTVEERSTDIYRVRINYRRIPLRHNLNGKCHKIVKFVSITHSERNIRNGPIVATSISREKRKPVLEGNGCLTGRAWLVRPGILWRFNARSNGNLDDVVLLRRRSKGGMNNFVPADASVVKKRVARGDQVLPTRQSTGCV